MSTRYSSIFSAVAVIACIQIVDASTVITQTFAPGELDGWEQIVIPGGNTDLDGIRFHATNATFVNRMLWQTPADGVGGLTVTSAAGTADYRGGAHNSAILRSPTFVLGGSNVSATLSLEAVTDVQVRLLGGVGSATGPASVGEIPANSVNQPQGQFVGYLGVALRRDSDDEYLLWERRTSNAQGTNWQTITWNESTFAAATAGDAPGTLYTIDLIDAAHGDWGWVSMDSATFTVIPEPGVAAMLPLIALMASFRRKR